MPFYSVKIRKTTTQEDEIVLRADDREDAEMLVEKLCFRDGYAGSLLGEAPRKIFPEYARKKQELEILEVKRCAAEDDPAAITPIVLEPNASISIE